MSEMSSTVRQKVEHPIVSQGGIQPSAPASSGENREVELPWALRVMERAEQALKMVEAQYPQALTKDMYSEVIGAATEMACLTFVLKHKIQYTKINEALPRPPDKTV